MWHSSNAATTYTRRRACLRARVRLRGDLLVVGLLDGGDLGLLLCNALGEERVVLCFLLALAVEAAAGERAEVAGTFSAKPEAA